MIWKSIKGYENEYEISETGLIKRISPDIAHPRIIEPYIVRGIKAVNLWKFGKRKSFSIHLLYMTAFDVSKRDAFRVVNKGYTGNAQAKQNIDTWLSEKIIECEDLIKQGYDLHDEILYLKEFKDVL